jgi:hypothetical protein
MAAEDNHPTAFRGVPGTHRASWRDRWRPSWPSIRWPSTRWPSTRWPSIRWRSVRWRRWPDPWEIGSGRPWTEGAGRAFQVVVVAVAVTALAGVGLADVLRTASDSSTPVQSEPILPWPEIDLTVPSPAPAPTDTGQPATTAPTPRPSAPARRTARPRPVPTTARPRPPVHLLSEAESRQHEVTGNTRPRSNDAASDDTVVGWVGNGDHNTLRLSATVPDADQYAVTLFYISADSRQATVRVNGGTVTTVDFPPTGDWETVRSLVLRLSLHSGQNTIELGNPDDYGPDFDRVMITR